MYWEVEVLYVYGLPSIITVRFISYSLHTSADYELAWISHQNDSRELLLCLSLSSLRREKTESENCSSRKELKVEKKADVVTVEERKTE